MQKVLKISILSVFLAGGVFALTTRTDFASNAAGNKIKLTEKSSSRSLYINNCARCHGADGKGDTELGKLYGSSNLTTRKVKRMSKKRMTQIIRNGVGGMPAFGKKLSNREITSLVNYVRSL